jgi:hypothetical protein
MIAMHLERSAEAESYLEHIYERSRKISKVPVVRGVLRHKKGDLDHNTLRR